MAGVSTDIDGDSDVRKIMDGGENFVARMTALQKRKRDLDQVIADLGIAMDYKNRSEEIRSNQEEAKKTLAEARLKAAALRKSAEDDAERSMKATNDHIEAMLREARDTASKIAREADDHLQKAKGRNSESSKVREELDKAMAAVAHDKEEAAKIADAAAKAEKDAEKLAYELQWRINALKEVVEQIQAAEVPPPNQQPTSEPPPPPEPEPEPEDPEPPPTRRKGRR